MFSYSKNGICLLAATATVAGMANMSSAVEMTGPSSSQSPYVVSAAPGVITKSIITVGDSVNTKTDGVTPYRMVGIPDGLGAYDNGDRKTFTILMNHELGPTVGVVREHGAPGAFISKWTVDKKTLRVLHGEDLIQYVATWNPLVGSYNPLSKGLPLGRLCSATLAPVSAFYYVPSNRRRSPLFPPQQQPVGYNGRLFTNGEEVGAEGRAFAHTLDGYTYELPRLGKMSFENVVPHPASGTKTVVVTTDDSTPGQVYVYVGDKTNTGSPVDRAGLTNGQLYGIQVQGIPDEDRTTGIASGTTFSLFNFGNVENQTGAYLQSTSEMAGVTEFLRPEDGAWDPRNPNDFYFVTTDRFDEFKFGADGSDSDTVIDEVGRSRLYRLRFFDISQPELGGTVDMLLDGTEPQQMMDNLTVDAFGRVLIQEDPGNQPYLARIWEYNIAKDTITEVGVHDPNRFAPGVPNLLTQDEESSGIIDVSDIFGPGYYIFDVQAHYSIGDPELVEDGQLLLMYDPIRKKKVKNR
ncbi:MAG TPA: alkaline phosphatase PhoX [Abditibacteriaceae bacterium]|jgi:hypothetical protein